MVRAVGTFLWLAMRLFLGGTGIVLVNDDDCEALDEVRGRANI